MTTVKAYVDHNTDWTKVGVLTEDELNAQVFRYGEVARALGQGERVALLDPPPGHAVSVLVYGHVPATDAARIAAECTSPESGRDAHRYAVGEPTWMLLTRHRLDCQTGGDPTVCGCLPANEADGWWAFRVTEGTPGAVPVMPVSLRGDQP